MAFFSLAHHCLLKMERTLLWHDVGFALKLVGTLSAAAAFVCDCSIVRPLFSKAASAAAAHRPSSSFESRGFSSIESEYGLLIHDVEGCQKYKWEPWALKAICTIKIFSFWPRIVLKLVFNPQGSHLHF